METNDVDVNFDKLIPVPMFNVDRQRRESTPQIDIALLQKAVGCKRRMSSGTLSSLAPKR